MNSTDERAESLRPLTSARPVAAKIPALTGLRFFAAMAIVFWHSQTGPFFKSGAFSPFYLAGAVPVFFVLSGFVLTIGADRYSSRLDFFVARLARLWPAHIAALVLVLLIRNHRYPVSLSFDWSLPLNALLLQSWVPSMAMSYNAPSWSVSDEMFFYAAFPLAFASLQRQTFARVAAIVTAVLCGILAVDMIRPGVDPNWLGSVLPLSGFAAFAIGVGAGIWWKRLPAPAGGYRLGSLIQLIALAGALGANVYFASHPIAASPATMAFIYLFGPSPCYACLLVALARYDGIVSRGLSLPLIVYGGEISYSIYLFHQIIIQCVSHLSPFLPVPIWWQYAGILAFTLCIAAAVHHLIERPARRTMIDGWRRLQRLCDKQFRLKSAEAPAE
jgi:peptidoglycan/LPS O-acetylase OafA/YrhL